MNEELEEFYLRLLESQEPLGEEFQKILDENIWDLYVSDEE